MDDPDCARYLVVLSDGVTSSPMLGSRIFVMLGEEVLETYRLDDPVGLEILAASLRSGSLGPGRVIVPCVSLKAE